MGDAGTQSWDADVLRNRFSFALSEMYKLEVPLYADLVSIVNEVDDKVLKHLSSLPQDQPQATHYEVPELPIRHRLERHGAIRLGTAQELRTIRRLFALFGMHPVGYYDLSVVGFPLHATAFRPLQSEALAKNPFRVFTTLLRQDMVSPDLRTLTERVLSSRKLFSDRLLELLDQAEQHHTLTDKDTNELLAESLKIFKWHSSATVGLDDYSRLKAEHPMIADIASFPSAHINHLTPRTLDIDLVQQTMVERGIPAKDRIEGPPRRACGILLRQTSFKALEERVRFHDKSGGVVDGTHTARFGEVEQRGAAVTFKGRELYDKLLYVTNSAALSLSQDSPEYEQVLKRTFIDYPDDWSLLRSQGLIFVQYKPTLHGRQQAEQEEGESTLPTSLERLVALGCVDYEPITYEDFLPFSAAGIFTSNLSNEKSGTTVHEAKGDQSLFTQALGVPVADQMALYEHMQRDSLEECRKALRLKEIIME